MKTEDLAFQLDYEKIFNTAPIIMFLVDSDRRVVRTNAETTKVLQKPENKLIGLRGGDLLGCMNSIINENGCGYSDECSSCVARNSVLDSLNNGTSNYKEEFSININCEDKVVKKYFDITTIPMKIKDQNYVLVSVQDITANKKNQLELEKHKNHLEELVNEKTEALKISNIKLEAEIKKQKIAERLTKKALKMEIEVNELIREFINSASHEFRTPLTAISMSAEILDMCGYKFSPEQVAKQTKRIVKSVDQITSLLDNINVLNKIENEREAGKKLSINLKLLCEKLIEDFSVKISEKQNMIFDYNCDKTDFEIDEKLLKLVLYHLLSNAVNYSPDGGEIALSVSCENKTLIFNISDQGLGIDKKSIEQIFLPFSRSTRTRYIPGTGIGLTIVKKSLDLLDGNIDINSSESVGTSIIVKIPI